MTIGKKVSVSLTWLAVDKGISAVIVNALASRLVVKWLTIGIQATCVRQQARILADSVMAGSIFGAVVVLATAIHALGVLTNLT